MNPTSRLTRFCTVIATAAIALLSLDSAHAEGFSMNAWGARGTSLAGGMIGRADDPSAIAHNPAGITQLPGTQMQAGVTIILPRGKMTTQGHNDILGQRQTGTDWNTTRADTHHWASPHIFLTQQINDSWWWGIGVFNRFGLGNSLDKNWPGSENLQEVYLQTTSVNPSLAWKVTDRLSIALGVEFLYGQSRIGHSYHMDGLGVENNNQRMKGSGHAWGGNIALHYRFNDQWQAGLTYRLPVNMRLTGSNRWDSEIALAYPPLAQKYAKLGIMRNSNVHATFHMPDSIAFGLTWKPMPNLSFEGGFVYTMWSRFHHLNLTLESPVDTFVETDKYWKNTWTFNVSTEYKPLDWLALRLGYAYQTSPMNGRCNDYMVPTNEYHRLGAGAGFTWDKWSLDLAYGFVYITDLQYTSQANGGASGVLEGYAHGVRAHEVAVSLGYKF